MKIKDVRLMYPNQLLPFYGLFGFTAQCNSFQGTLFRFPIMGSRNRSHIFSARRISLPLVESTLQKYYNDALISLLFLENIRSIEFHVRRNESAALTMQWKVEASKQPIPGDEAGTLKCKIESYKTSLGKAEVPIVQEWVVVSSRYGVLGAGNEILETQKRHRVEARCGVAAPIVQKPTAPGRGRLYMDVPMQHELGLPVSISAVCFLPSSRAKTLLTSDSGLCSTK